MLCKLAIRLVCTAYLKTVQWVFWLNFTPSSLMSRVFSPNCVGQLKSSISFPASTDLLCGFHFCFFSRSVIFSFFFNISCTFTLSTVGSTLSTDFVGTDSSERVASFNKVVSFKSGIGEGKFCCSVNSCLYLSSFSRRAYSISTPFWCTRLILLLVL